MVALTGKRGDKTYCCKPVLDDILAPDIVEEFVRIRGIAIEEENDGSFDSVSWADYV
jgi:hypothetical protein